ncbi:MAG: zinc ribbon domain-containing protein [Lachnospiraceae bacterium]|nr:zinc ribbon domain-containing protein [Lachnospiraceae bacterium]
MGISRILGIVLLVMLCAFIIGAGISVCYIRRRLKDVSRAAFGTESFLEGVKKQEEQFSETPKSVSGMTELYLQKITKDFPEFSYAEIASRSENLIKEVLAAVERENISGLPEDAGELKRQVRLWIEDNRRQGIREIFQNPVIHKTAIFRYEKRGGMCVLVLQSALEYRYARYRKTDENQAEEPKKLQTRCSLEWNYIQDVDRVPEEKRVLASNCPNCGAPIKSLGSRFCEYCGSAVEPVNIRVWSPDHIKLG